MRRGIVMKTYAPKALRGGDLRDLMAQLFTDPLALSKFVHVSERTVWRWLKEDSCPWPVLALLWHETPKGREAAALDVGNLLNIHRGLSQAHEAAHGKTTGQLARLLAISDTGAANDPLLSGPVCKPASGLAGRARAAPVSMRYLPAPAQLQASPLPIPMPPVQGQSA
jgi:hypothetical protein